MNAVASVEHRCGWQQNAAFVFYQLITKLLRGLALIGVLGRQAKSWIESRQLSKNKLSGADLSNVESLFFCSSAGEYSQIAVLLEKYGMARCVVVFFSDSGMRFIEEKGLNKQYPGRFYLAPWDDYLWWSGFFKKSDIRRSYIVRHEIWPGFCRAAAENGHLYLVNASFVHARPSGVLGEVKNRFKNVFKNWVFSYFDKIYVSYPSAINSLKSLYPKGSFSYCPDTKYDIEALNHSKNQNSIRQRVAELNKKWGWSNRELVILGSCWIEDLRYFLPGLLEFVKIRGGRHSDIVVVPHDISDTNILVFKDYLKSLKCAAVLANNAYNEKTAHDSVLIVNEIGILQEMYRYSKVAIVGGSVGRKVHNVLEPASFGNFVIVGPDFENSHEAMLLVEKGAVKTIKDSGLVFEVLQDSNAQDYGKKAVQVIASLRGGSEMLYNQIQSLEKEVERKN